MGIIEGAATAVVAKTAAKARSVKRKEVSIMQDCGYETSVGHKESVSGLVSGGRDESRGTVGVLAEKRGRETAATRGLAF